MAENTAGFRNITRVGRVERAFGKSSATRPRCKGSRSAYHKLLSAADTDTLEFEIFGAVCRRQQFTEHFNFRQRWSPFAHTGMSTMLGDSPQTLTLALNILDCYFRLNDGISPRRRADPRAFELMHQFADEILAPLAGSSWHLPTESLARWTQVQLTQLVQR